MHRMHPKWNRAVPCFAVALLMNTTAGAQSWYDDFEDGNLLDGSPVQWVIGGIGVEGDFDASTGDLVMTPGAVGVTAAEVEQAFSGTASVRAQLRWNGPRGRGGVGIAELGTGDGYVAQISQDGRFALARADDGLLFTLAIVQAVVPVGQDVLVQLDREGCQLTGRIWLPGTPMPDVPQLVVTDCTYGSGNGGVWFADDFGSFDPPLSATFRFIQASDAPIVDPACLADLSGDSIVDGADLGIMLAAWATDDPSANIDGLGVVDGADLGLMLSAWGACR
ncbi:MAG: hypothetical protein U0575_07750 [Phycisphaerales bacterium]